MSILYVVATPIGNLEDLTLRALKVLREADLIAAEDTRVTRKLLSRYEIRTPVTSYHEHNKRSKLPVLLRELKHKTVAVVSDAGVPGVSDPGAELVAAAAEAGVQVAVIPGPSAVTAAIAASGLAVPEYVYLGFLPRRKGERRKALESTAGDGRVLVAFEAPHRLLSSLADILDTLGDRRIAVCRELTKLHEEVFRGTVSGALSHFDSPRGEFTLVIEGAAGDRQAETPRLQLARTLVAQLHADGARAKDAVAQVSERSGMSKKEAYRLWIEAKSGKG